MKVTHTRLGAVSNGSWEDLAGKMVEAVLITRSTDLRRGVWCFFWKEEKVTRVVTRLVVRLVARLIARGLTN